MRLGKVYIACITVLLAASAAAFGQDASPATSPAPAEQARPQKPNLMTQLGLSSEQMQQIRKLNVERKPRMEAAQLRLRSANRSLDEAIYADTANDTDIDARVKEVQAAQAEMIALRSANELAVRRILTPEQLVRFREMRSKFDKAREQMQERRRAMRPGRVRPAANLNKHGKPL